MNAEEFLKVALGGNMNMSTLKPLAWYGIMESYAKHALQESKNGVTEAEQVKFFAKSVFDDDKLHQKKAANDSVGN